MEERILTLHPAGKKGVRILKRRYKLVADYIMDQIDRHQTISFKTLSEHAHVDLRERLDGSPSWYITTVKLDLEARGIIERVPGTSPHQLKKKG